MLERFISASRDITRSYCKYNAAHGALRAALVAGDSLLSADYMRSYRRAQWRVLTSSGVGGMDYRSVDRATVKCIHLQIASWLGWGWHPASAWLEREVGSLECACGACVSRYI